MKNVSKSNLFRSFKYYNFRLFFSGQSISLIGTWIQRIATPWLVYRLTGSAFLLGFVGFAGQIPTFLLAPFMGVMTDKFDKHKLLIATQVLAMLQSFTLYILFALNVLTIWHLVVLNVILGCINALDVPVRQSFVVKMVGKKDIGNAIALNSSMVNGARLIGPSIAGVLIAITGEGACFLINSISYIFVIISLFMMKVEHEHKKVSDKNVYNDLKEGFKYTFGSKVIRPVIFLLALISLMGMPYTVLMPVITRDVLHQGSHAFGFLMGASGVGALICAIYMASRKSAKGLEIIIPLASSIFGMGLILFSFSRSLIPSILLLFIVGFGMLMQLTASNTLLQTIVTDDKRGRVMSFYTMAFMGTAPFGSLLGGSMAGLIGAPLTITFGGATCIIGAFIFGSRLPKIKSILYQSTETVEAVNVE